MKQRLLPFVQALANVPNLEAKVAQDAAGREIYRAAVTVTPESAKDAKAIIQALKAGDPAIYTREYRANEGVIEFDIRAVDATEMKQIVDRLQAIQS